MPKGSKPDSGTRYGSFGSNACTVQVHSVPRSGSTTTVSCEPVHFAQPVCTGNATVPQVSQRDPASRGGSSVANSVGATAVTLVSGSPRKRAAFFAERFRGVAFMTV